MRLPLYQVDAFTSRLFGGNPAGIVPLDSWLPDAVMQSSKLTVTRRGDELAMELPSRPPQPCVVPPDLDKALGKAPVAVSAARDYLMVYEREADLRALAPDMARIARLDRFAVIVTAPGESCDFVSRFFAPAQGIPEDPVTGSAHCTLVPYWSKRLGKKTLQARQISPRVGELTCEDRGDRVVIAGKAVLYLEGTIHV